MKDLDIYFSEFGEKSGHSSPTQIGSKIVVNQEGNFSLPQRGDVAILFVPEYRNSDLESGLDFISTIREKLYALESGEWNSSVVDMGTIVPGKTVEDTFTAVRDVVKELVKGGVFPLVIGGSQDLTLALYEAYQSLEQTVNILDIDPGLDMGDPDEAISSNAWLNKILLHKPNFLFNYSLLGYQSYLVKSEERELLNKLYFDGFRLGEFYANDKMVEPLVRNADILTFDLDAIRGSDYNGNSRHLPHGFYGEDACRILRYAGLSDKLTSLGLFNFQQSASILFDSNLVAQMIWYFIEGFNQRKKDYPVGSKNSYTKYLVSIDDFKDEIVFYKSDKTARWWMEVPYPKMEGVKFQRHLLIPCNYEDYQNALTNEMPNLWWKTFEKLS